MPLFFPPPLSFSVLASVIFVSYEDSNVLFRIKLFVLVMKIAMYYVESKLPVRSFFFCQQDSPTHGRWSTFLIWKKKKKRRRRRREKYIPLTLNTWIEGGYKTKAFMSYSVQSWASWIVWLLLLVIRSLWAPLLELFFTIAQCHNENQEANHCHGEFDPRKHLFFPVCYKKINEVISNIQHWKINFFLKKKVHNAWITLGIVLLPV